MEIVWKYNPRELTSGYGLTENGNLTDAIGNTYEQSHSILTKKWKLNSISPNWTFMNFSRKINQ